MVIGTAAAIGTASFGGILLLCNEEPDEVHPCVRQPHYSRLSCSHTLFFCSALSALLRIDVNIILLPSLILFFFPYRCTVAASLPKCLAVYVGVCAVHTFPAQFSYALDAFLHPASGAADFSVEAAFFRLLLSCLVAAAFALPACGLFSGSLTVWTLQRYGTPPSYCPPSFCSST